jgi:hypothetical protein
LETVNFGELLDSVVNDNNLNDSQQLIMKTKKSAEEAQGSTTKKKIGLVTILLKQFCR